MTIPEQIEFNRPAKYKYVQILGNGACGETIHIRDEGMACDFVVKKYRPIFLEAENFDLFSELLRRFKEEARILFSLNHPNVVRVYNFFDYSEHKTSYIVMEYVSGKDLLEYLSEHPENADRVFEGVIDGFVHLAESSILHRDIRPANILINNHGAPKIIDFGFGKQISEELGVFDDKSISLNWWCEIPPEFGDGVYDFKTEVYFVGKLFQLAMKECSLSDFKYRNLLTGMSEADRDERTDSFRDVQRLIVQGKFDEIKFSHFDIKKYRAFVDELISAVSTIQSDAKFEKNPEKIINRLETLYKKTMLEEFIPLSTKLISIFISGGEYRYWKRSSIRVDSLKNFIELIRGASGERRNIILENVLMRLEAVDRKDPEIDLDDEIPF